MCGEVSIEDGLQEMQKRIDEVYKIRTEKMGKMNNFKEKKTDAQKYGRLFFHCT